VKLIEYIGRQLKEDVVVELLERHDMEVIYRFDRLHENSPDEYTAAAPEAGFELSFDDRQVLTTVFCHVEPRDGFSSVDPATIGVAIFSSPAEARGFGEARAMNCKYKDGVLFLGRQLSWVSFELESGKVHYEYSSAGLSMITLSIAEAVV
jgi:hypothetical protein